MKSLRGSAFLAFASGSDALAAFAVGVLVARSGGPEALGRLAATMALLLFGVTATEMGQNVVLARRAASGDPRAGAGLGASLLCKAAAAAVLAPVAVLLWPATEPWWGTGAALANLLLSSWTISATAILRGREHFGVVALGSGLSGAAAVATVAAVRPTTLAGVLTILALAQALKTLVAFALLPRGTRPERPAAPDVRGLVVETLPFGAIVLVSVAYLKADVLLLSALSGAAEAGRYAAAARLIEALKLGPAALGAALFPALVAGREAELRRTVTAAAGFGVAVVAAAWAAGESMLTSLFGEGFAVAAAPLRVLAVAFIVSSVNALLILALYARREERAALLALVAALAANLMANALLIPGAGAQGAAAAALLSETILAGLYVRALRSGDVRVAVMAF